MKEINLDEFVKICENHQHFLNRDCENWKDLRADFGSCLLKDISYPGSCLLKDISYFGSCLLKDISYSGINLDLSYAFMDYAELDNVDLRSINLYGALLRHCNIHDSNFVDVNFKVVNMNNSTLKSSRLSSCNFGSAYLTNVNFDGSYFLNCNFNKAMLMGSRNVPFIPTLCPEEGSFIGWKKCIKDICEGKIHTFCLVKLEILADAKRSSATGRKCRCSKAKVLSIETFDGKPLDIAYSQHDISFTYKVGDIVSVDNFNEDRFNECAPGIHFFINKQEAINYVL